MTPRDIIAFILSVGVFLAVTQYVRYTFEERPV